MRPSDARPLRSPACQHHDTVHVSSIATSLIYRPRFQDHHDEVRPIKLAIQQSNIMLGRIYLRAPSSI